jgi:hypothetical protein
MLHLGVPSVLEFNYLCMAIPITHQIAIPRAEPDAARGIGGNLASRRHGWRRKLLLNLQVVNANKCSRRASTTEATGL